MDWKQQFTSLCRFLKSVTILFSVMNSVWVVWPPLGFGLVYSNITLKRASLKEAIFYPIISFLTFLTFWLVAYTPRSLFTCEIKVQRFYGIQNDRLDLMINKFLTVWKTIHYSKGYLPFSFFFISNICKYLLNILRLPNRHIHVNREIETVVLNIKNPLKHWRMRVTVSSRSRD